jgi:peptidoglycan/xylan/chitin deacetylase (PgdA/CDA1 family)
MRLDIWSLLERVFGWGGVIAYHGVGESPASTVMHVSPKRLLAQLELLRDRYRVVPLRVLVDRWRAGESTRNCVAITFDDAYAGVLIHALPILRSLDIPATVFVASDYAALGASYWWDSVERQRVASEGREWIATVKAVGLAGADRSAPTAIDQIRNRVLARFAGRWPGELSSGGESVWRSLTFAELELLAAHDRIEFGVHTLSHPALPLLAYDEQVDEIRNNLTVLRNRLPRVIPVIAYPYGLYDRTTVRAAQAAGMIAGLTMEGRATADRPDPMIAPRIGAGEIHAPKSLTRRLNRALRPALVMRNRGAHPRMPVDPISGASHQRVAR